jgi:hypothetical protein
MRSVYYAHSQTTYGSDQEKADLEMLEELGFHVYNPNNPFDGPHFEADGMAHFDKLTKKFHFAAIFYRTYRAGVASYGTGYEVRWAQKNGVPTFEITEKVAAYSKKGTGQAYAEQGRDDLAKLY